MTGGSFLLAVAGGGAGEGGHHMASRHRLASLVAFLALLVAPVAPLQATNGHFLHGVGAINSAMGGAGVGAPTDLLGTIYLNPAGLIVFEPTRVDLGFEMFRPDRSVETRP